MSRPGLLRFPEPTPVDGDIVLRTSGDCPTDYLLCRAPAPDQIRCAAYADALNVATRWARRGHVDVWLDEGEHAFVLLSRHRPDFPASR